MNLLQKRLIVLLALAGACLTYQGIQSSAATAYPLVKASFAPLPNTSGEVSLNDGMWKSPTKPLVVEAVFRQPNSDWGAGHRGIDLLVLPASPLLAPTNARLNFAGPVFGRPVVTLLTDEGLTLEFEPACLPEVPALETIGVVGVVAELSLPHVGQTVFAGQPFAVFCPIGLSTHCSVECLHWGVRTQSRGYLSPQRFVKTLEPARPKSIGL